MKFERILTVRVIILSKSMTGAMWKSNTKYWKEIRWRRLVIQLRFISFCLWILYNYNRSPHYNMDNLCSLSLTCTSFDLQPEIYNSFAFNFEFKLIPYVQLTCTQTTGSILRPASCLASMTVMQTWKSWAFRVVMDGSVEVFGLLKIK